MCKSNSNPNLISPLASYHVKIIMKSETMEFMNLRKFPCFSSPSHEAPKQVVTTCHGNRSVDSVGRGSRGRGMSPTQIIHCNPSADVPISWPSVWAGTSPPMTRTDSNEFGTDVRDPVVLEKFKLGRSWEMENMEIASGKDTKNDGTSP